MKSSSRRTGRVHYPFASLKVQLAVHRRKKSLTYPLYVQGVPLPRSGLFEWYRIANVGFLSVYLCRDY